MLQVAFDASSEAMVIADSGLLVRWANQRAADLWANGLAITLPGKPLSGLIQVHASDGALISEADPLHPLRRLEAGDGQGRYLLRADLAQALAPPLPDHGGLVPHQLSWREIPQLRQSFWLLRIRSLAPQERALYDQQVFLNMLAHELRTPLTIVMGSLRRLERSHQVEDPLLPQLQIAQQEARRINRLLMQLTLLSELDTGIYHWDRCPSSLLRLLREWSTSLELDVQRRLQLNLTAIEPELLVDLDQKAFNLVLNNLIDNSMRYGHAGVVVSLSARVLGSTVEVVVRDTGPGIPEEVRAGIFDRFRRLERTRDPSQSDGSGLGLAVVKAFTEAMGGSVGLEPEGSGLGVILRWPVVGA